MNKFKAILSRVDSCGSVCRLHLNAAGVALSALIIDEARVWQERVGSGIEFGFKEDNVTLAADFSGLYNTFNASVQDIECDALFMRVKLAASFGGFYALMPRFCEITTGGEIACFIPENEIMLYYPPPLRA